MRTAAIENLLRIPYTEVDCANPGSGVTIDKLALQRNHA
jgi:hypothetical protein